jgi:fumarate hydratase, class I
MDRRTLQQSLLELVRRTSADIPDDVAATLVRALRKEEKGTTGRYAMEVIWRNCEMAEAKSQPICQDTGSILFFVTAPKGFDEALFKSIAGTAVSEATKVGYLRQNSVDSLTGRNSGTNLGPGSPTYHFEQGKGAKIDVRVVLKGGGCENMGAQYSLPDSRLGADRDIAGVEKCILDAVNQAQGKGCGPGILGVTIGGDRATGYLHSKEQFLRKLDDKNPNKVLARLEKSVIEKANSLGIGPMGFGGHSTLLGCKIGVLNRLPASFFVSVSYMCWAYRRQGVVLDSRGRIREWLY